MTTINKKRKKKKQTNKQTKGKKPTFALSRPVTENPTQGS